MKTSSLNCAPTTSPSSPSRFAPLRWLVLSLLWPLISTLALLLAAPTQLQAMPANPAPFTCMQPGGAVITLRMFGNAKMHGMEDLEGYTVVKNAAGAFVYAVKAADGSLAASSWVVGVHSPVTAGLTKHLREAPAVVPGQNSTSRTSQSGGGGSQTVPRIAPTGTVKNLVILCRFSDHTLADHTRSQADFDVLFNSERNPITGFPFNPAITPTGSVRDYFKEVSYNTMFLNSTVTAWVTLPHPEAYYVGAHHGFDNAYPANVQGMAVDALQLVDPVVNFAEFDQNNDGFVDSITFIHSGYGAEAGDPGASSRIWSGKTELPGNLETTDFNTAAVPERVKVRAFHTEPALWGTSGTEITRLAVICHETCHFFGLPDLYDTDNSSRGVGDYCLMGNGWGLDGTQLRPPHLCAWSKMTLGWLTPTVIYPSPDVVTTGSVNNAPLAYKITTGFPAGEYLLIESRQAVSAFDGGFNGPRGIAIWHIDENMPDNTKEGFPGQSNWPQDHYKVALIQADGLFELERNLNSGGLGDYFPQYYGPATGEITPQTVPNTNRYQGGVLADTWNSITEITRSGPGPFYDPVTFRYSGLSRRIAAASQVMLTVPTFAPAGEYLPELGFAPAQGTTLTVVNNTGSAPPQGTFSNLAQGQVVTMSYQGKTYHFAANYFGGTGNDLLLQWADTRPVAWGGNGIAQLGAGLPDSAVPTGQPRIAALVGKTVVSEAMASNFSVAVGADGSLVYWGQGESTPTVLPVGGALVGKTPVAVACGEFHALILCSDGTIAGWGPNTYGELGTNSTASAGSSTPVAVTTALNDGSALAGKTVVAISAGQYHSVALCSDGTVATWGRNDVGQLGIGNTVNRLVPTLVSTAGNSALAGKTVKAIAAGANHTLALSTTGLISAWGGNSLGAVGDNGNSTVPVTAPVAVVQNQNTPLGSKTVTAIAAGTDHSVALCSDGTLAVWGWYGILDSFLYAQPEALVTTGALAGKTVTSVAAGAKHVVGLCSDGTAVAWGSNAAGQLGSGNTVTPAPLTPVTVSISGLQSGEKIGTISSGPLAPGTLAQLTVPPAPIVTTLAATAITGTTVTLNATVNARDNDTTVTFNRNPSGGTTSAPTPATVTGATPTAVSATVTGLQPGTTYSFQVQAVNAAGTRHGATLSFTTQSNSGNLSALVVSGVTLSPVFATATTAYTATVPYTTSSVTVTPTAVQSAVTIRVNGTIVPSGTASGAIALVPGLNTITTAATAQDGTVKTYVVALTRIAPVAGSVLTDFDPGSTTRPAFALEQPDRRIMLAWDDGSTRPTYLTRLTSAGAADPSFSGLFPSRTNCLTVLPDGKMLFALGGYSFTVAPGVTRNGIMRINADGTPDPTFDAGFTAPTGIGAVSVQPDGKLIITGGFNSVGGVARQNIARLNANGSHDTSFVPPAIAGYPVAVVRQLDGRLLVSSDYGILVRLNSNGTLDSTFSVAVSGRSTSYSEVVNAIVVQPDGKIVIGGNFTSINGTTRICLARLNANGTVDTTWNPVLTAGAEVDTLALQTDGKIVIGGYFSSINGVARARIGRVNADGSLDPVFNPNAGNRVQHLTYQKDGRILVSGAFSTIGGLSRNSLARLENDPVSETLTLASSSRIEWLRGGAAGEPQFVTFEHSATGGATYTPLGTGTRIAGGWELTGLSLPASGKIRARARIPGGYYGGSSSLADTEITYGSNPELVVENSGVEVADGASLALGNGFIGSSSTPLVLTIKNTGPAALTLSPPTKDGTNAADFTITNPVATTLAPGASTTMTVAFTPVSGSGARTAALHFVNNDTDESPFDLTLTGTILTAGAVESGSQSVLNQRVLAMAVQPDGKIMVGGEFSTAGGLSRLALARLNPNGITVDSTFPSVVGGTSVLGINLLPDGKMLVCGRNAGIRPVGGTHVTRNHIARLDTTGLLDASFNASLTFNNPNPNWVNGSALQPDGKLLIWGNFNEVTPPGSAAIPQWDIARYHTDGSLDTSFNPGPSGEVRSLLLLPDGSMILGGNVAGFYAGSNSSVTPVLRQGCAKLTAAGVLEPSFNVNFGEVYALSQTADSSVLIATGTGIRKFSTSGVEDTTFSVVTNGIVHTLAVQTDGRILVGGEFTTIRPTGAATALAIPRLVRLQANGSHDPTFVPPAYTFGTVQSIAHRPDGGLLIGGLFNHEGGTIYLHRLINEPATQSLNVASMARVEWSRSGGGAEVHRVLFDLSTDNGATWTPLGSGSRIGVTSNWHITGVALAASGTVRVRGFTRNGMNGGNSTSIFEQTKTFSNPVADMPVVTLPTATDLFARGVTLGATVASDSGAAITERGVIYAPTYLTATPVLDQPGVSRINEVGTVGAFSTPVTGLIPSTAYTFRGYAINSIGLSYTAPAQFTTPAALALSVVANSATRPYGATDPAFTGTLTGGSADGITAGYTSSATPTSPPGTYVVVPSLADPLSRLAKYTVASTPGTFTITQATTTTTADFVGINAAAAAQSITLTAMVRSTIAGQPGVEGGTVTFQLKSGAANVGSAVTSSAIAAGVASVSYTIPAGQAIGTYSIAATYSGTANHVTSTHSAATLTITAVPLRSFLLSGIVSPLAAGLNSTITVTARDAAGQLLPSYRGTIRFSSSDLRATLPADYTFTAADSGVHSFTVVLRSAGTHSVSVTDASVSLTGSLTSLVVTPRSAAPALMSWGENTKGQLGDGSFAIPATTIPAVVPNFPESAVSIACGGEFTLVATGTQAVWACGANESAQLGNGLIQSGSPTFGRVLSESGSGYLVADKVAAGLNFALALKADGTVVQWGYDPVTLATVTRPTAVPGLTGVTDIAAGMEYCLARKNDGTLWAWGTNDYGQLGQGHATASLIPVQVKNAAGSGFLTNVVSMSAGDTFALAVKSDGTVWAWGSNANGRLGESLATAERLLPVAVAGISGSAIAVAANGRGGLVLRADRTLVSWGSTWFGPVMGLNGVGLLQDVVSISGSRYDQMARLPDGSVVSWTSALAPRRLAGITGGTVLGHSSVGNHHMVGTVPQIPTQFIASHPATAASGVPFSLSIKAVDAQLNSVVFVGAVSVRSSQRETLSPNLVTFTAADQGQKTVNLTVQYSGLHELTYSWSGSSEISVLGHPTRTLVYLGSSGNIVTAEAYVFLTPEGGRASGGTVKFRLLTNGGASVLGPFYGAVSANGVASTIFAIPPATAAGDYKVEAEFSGSTLYAGSTVERPIRLIAGGVVAPLTSVSGKYSSGSQLTTHSSTSTENSSTVEAQLEGRMVASVSGSLSYKLDSQTAAFSATSILPVGAVDQGFVAFTVTDPAGTIVGLPNIGPVVTGACTVNYILPPELAPGNYLLTTLFSGGLTAASSRNERLITVLPTTSTVAANAVIAEYNPQAQEIILSGTVSSTAGTLSSGTVTFQVRNDGAGSAAVGPPVVCAVIGGQVEGGLTLPAGLLPGTYRIETTFASSTPHIAVSTDNAHSLTVIRVPIITEATVSDASLIINGQSQPLTLQANVLPVIGSALSQGTVTFRISRAGVAIGTAVTSAPLSAGVATAIYIMPPTAVPGTYRIEATYNGSTPPTGAAYDTSTDLAVLTLTTQQQAWRQQYFGTTAATGNAAPTADPDGDGLDNLTEYAFGQNPTSASSSSLPTGQRLGANYSVSFAQPSGVSGITYGAESSPSLAPGSWTPIPDTGAGSVHTFSVPAADQRKFLRVTISEP